MNQDRVRIVIEVQDEDQARRALQGVAGAVSEVKKAAGAGAGGVTAEEILPGLGDMKKRLDALQGSLRQTPAAAGVAAEGVAGFGAAAGVAAGTALTLAAVIGGTLTNAVRTFGETKEGKQALDELERSAKGVSTAFGRQFESEVRLGVEALTETTKAAAGADIVYAALADTVRGLIGPVAFLVRDFARLNEQLRSTSIEDLESRTGGVGRQERASSSVVDGWAERLRQAAARRAERVRGEQRDAEEAARQLQREQALITRAALVGAPDDVRQAASIEAQRQEAIATIQNKEKLAATLALIDENALKAFEQRKEREAEVARQSLERIVQSTLQGEERIRALGENRLAQVEKIAAAGTITEEKAAQARAAVHADTERQITELREKEEAERERITERAERERIRSFERVARERERVENAVLALERDAALAGLDVFQRIEHERLESIRRIEQDVMASTDQIERARAAAAGVASDRVREAHERIFEDQQRQLDRGLRQWEMFWDRVSRNANSTKDFLGNLGDEIANNFRRTVVRMVGSLIFGQQQAAGVAAGGALGGGGVFGSILGGLGGGIFGGAGGVGATPPFVQSAFPGGGFGGFGGAGATPPFVPGGGIGAGRAGSIPGLGFPSAAGVGGGGFGNFGGLLSPAVGLGLLLGTSASSPGQAALRAGIGFGGGIALAGAQAGVAGGIGALSGIGTAFLGLAANPIGLAVLGGVVGVSALLGALGRGGKKRQAAGVANKGFAAIDETVEAFSQRQIRYEQALLAMERQWAEMEEAWGRIGGSVGRQSAATQRPHYERRVDEVERIQAERLRRLEAMDRLPLPAFAGGGLVRGAMGAAVPAIVHAGEYVIRQEAVQRVGPAALEAINRGEVAGGVNVTIHINGGDAAGLASYVRSGELETAVGRAVRNLRKDGRLR